MIRELRSRPRLLNALGSLATWSVVASPVPISLAAVAGLTTLGHHGQTKTIEGAADSGTAQVTGVEVVDGVYLGLQRRGIADEFYVHISPIVISRDAATVTELTINGWDGLVTHLVSEDLETQATTLSELRLAQSLFARGRFNDVSTHTGVAGTSVLVFDSPAADNTLRVSAVIDGTRYDREITVPYDVRERLSTPADSAMPAPDNASSTGIGLELQ